MTTSRLSFIFFIVTFFVSCKQSSNVVSNSLIQKRKHLKGWHLSDRMQFMGSEKNSQQELREPKARPLPILTHNVSTLNEISKNLSGYGMIANHLADIENVQNDLTHRVEECDILLLQTGKELKVKVLEVSSSIVKYKMCDNITGPTFTKSSSEIFMIKYPNGSSTLMSDFNRIENSSEVGIKEVDKSKASSNSKNPPVEEKQVEPLGTVGLIAAVIGLVLAILGGGFGSLILLGVSLILSGSALILSRFSLFRIEAEPEKFKGKTLAEIGMGLAAGTIASILLILLLL